MEKTMALLEHGKHGLAFATGMGAIKLFNPGDHLIVSEDLYGGTTRLRLGPFFTLLSPVQFAVLERRPGRRPGKRGSSGNGGGRMGIHSPAPNGNPALGSRGAGA
jgi:hypothetical protein